MYMIITPDIHINDIFLEQKNRIQFAKEYVKGKVLIVSFRQFLGYHASKFFLENGAKEVWFLDISTNPPQKICRFYDSKKNMKYQYSFSKELFSKNMFDCIIMFEALKHVSNKKNFLIQLNEYLGKNGTLVLSITNKEQSKIFDDMINNYDEVNEIPKNNILPILNEIFPKTEVFSQRLISKKEIKDKKIGKIIQSIFLVRGIIGIVFSKIDRKSTFYSSYLQKTMTNINKKTNTSFGSKEEDSFVPKKYEVGNAPLFYVIVCKK